MWLHNQNTGKKKLIVCDKPIYSGNILKKSIREFEEDYEQDDTQDDAHELIEVRQFYGNFATKKLRDSGDVFKPVKGKLNVVSYIVKKHYIYIVEKQLVNGQWDDRVLNFTKAGPNNLNAIKQSNPQAKVAYDAVWYTLIGLKLLKQQFSQDAKGYELVEKKAR